MDCVESLSPETGQGDGRAGPSCADEVRKSVSRSVLAPPQPSQLNSYKEYARPLISTALYSVFKADGLDRCLQVCPGKGPYDPCTYHVHVPLGIGIERGISVALAS